MNLGFNHSGLDPLTIIHTSFEMTGDQAKAPPEIQVIIIQIDNRITGQVRQNSSIMEEVDFMPALMLDALE